MKFVYIVTALVCIVIGVYCTEDAAEEGRPRLTRQTVGEMFDMALKIGNSLKGAIQFLKQLVNGKLSEVLMEVENLTKWFLVIHDIEILDGDTNIQSARISPAIRGGWAGSNKPKHQGSEGYAVISLSTHSFCLIYWRVQSKYLKRKPNALAVGCMPTNNTAKDMNDELLKTKQSSTHQSDYISYQEYDNRLPTIHFCNEMVCLQGRMGPLHLANATVEIFPRNIANIAPSLKPNITQELLDDFISDKYHAKFGDIEGKRKRGRHSKIIISCSVIGGTILLIIIIGICCCWLRKSCCCAED